MVKKRKGRSEEIDLLRISYFILLNTMIFHEVLSSQWKQVKSLRVIKKDLQIELLAEWEHIEKDINYKPVFELARQIIEALPTGPETERALLELKSLALSVVGSGVQLRHDLMGRIYHKLLLQTTGGYYATYYTSVPAAVLLSELLVKTKNPFWDFSDLENLKRMKIIDPACGSGTLLASTYASIRDTLFLEPNQILTDQTMAELHKSLMENGLYGMDVLDYASHLTLSTLAMQNAKAKFQGSQIHTLNNGVSKDGKVFLGSLDYLDKQGTIVARKWVSSPTDEIETEKDVFISELPKESFDIVIMNPPFSRSANPNMKFGYASKEIRQKMNDRLKELTSQLGLEGIGVAGLGSHFIVMGDKLLKPGGRFGVVIPRHILSGVSWGKIRNILSTNYDLEYIISNFDPTPFQKDHGWCWSENTELGEVLIIARKLHKEEDHRRCFYINITRHPQNEVESLSLSQNILFERKMQNNSITDNAWSEIKTGDQSSGFAYWVENKFLERNWHYACLFSHPQIVKFTLELLSNSNLTNLGPFLEKKGRDIAMVKKNFSQASIPTSYRILYGHQKEMNTISLSDNFIKYGRPRTGEGTNADKIYREFSSDFLIAERPHVNSENLLAIETSIPVLATAFWEVKLKDYNMRNFLLLWLNSTFGFLAALGAGANSQGPIFKIKQEHLDSILIPSPNQEMLKDATNLYSSIKSKQFKTFKEEFKLAEKGEGVRVKIDNFFAPIISPSMKMTDIYKLLSQEPALTLSRL